MRSPIRLLIAGLAVSLSACAPDAPDGGVERTTARPRATVAVPQTRAPRARNPRLRALSDVAEDDASETLDDSVVEGAHEHADTDEDAVPSYAHGCVLDAAGEPVVGVHLRFVNGYNRDALWSETGCGGAFGWERDDLPADAAIGRVVAWTDGEDGPAQVAFTPWRETSAGCDFGTLRLRPRSELSDSEDIAVVDAWCRRRPTNGPPPPPPSPEPMQQEDLRTFAGVVLFEGEPVTNRSTPSNDCYMRRTGRVVDVLVARGSVPMDERHRIGGDGTFAFDVRDALAADTADAALWFHVAADHEPFAKATPADRRVSLAEARSALRVELPRAARPSVILEVGEALGRATWTELRCVPLDGGPDREEFGTTSGGPFHLRLRPGARYSLLVRVRCGDLWLRPARVAEFVASDEPIRVPFSRGETLSGVVMRENGTPVPGAHVYVSCGARADVTLETWTGIRGEFSVDGLESGPVTVFANAPDFTAEMSATPGGALGAGPVQIVGYHLAK